MKPSSLLISTIIYLLGNTFQTTESFSVAPSIISRALLPKLSSTSCFSSSDDTPSTENTDQQNSAPKKKKGDSLRDATGIRPSLHPTTINCIAEALLLRAKKSTGGDDTTTNAIDIANKDIQPIQIAINAGTIAYSAIEQRNKAAETDETTDIFTPEEAQTISGRVVGVVMRMRELEQTLIDKVNNVNWVTKYGEEESFGLLKSECRLSRLGSEESGKSPEEVEMDLSEKMKLNPLLRMNRAECLLALFIVSVEQPTLEKIGQTVSGGSSVDFIDGDRMEVLGVV